MFTMFPFSTVPDSRSVKRAFCSWMPFSSPPHVLVGDLPRRLVDLQPEVRAQLDGRPGVVDHLEGEVLVQLQGVLRLDLRGRVRDGLLLHGSNTSERLFSSRSERVWSMRAGPSLRMITSGRHLAAAEALEVRLLAVFLDDAVVLLPDVLRGDVDGELHLRVVEKLNFLGRVHLYNLFAEQDGPRPPRGGGAEKKATRMLPDRLRP